jgi:hypothetical protein
VPAADRAKARIDALRAPPSRRAVGLPSSADAKEEYRLGTSSRDGHAPIARRWPGALVVAEGASAQEGTQAALPVPSRGKHRHRVEVSRRRRHRAGSRVVFTDDFEGAATRFSNNWGGTGLSPAPENVHGGKHALDCSLPYHPGRTRKPGRASASLPGRIRHAPLRYYAKYGKTTELYHGATHNGGGIGATAPGVPEAQPGVPADGKNKYGILLDTYRGENTVASPGPLAIYIYHPEQRHQWGEHFYPSGRIAPVGANPNYFGPRFVPRPDLIPDRDRWICYEVMVKANTPGQRDGRIAFWIDGRLAADFPNLRLRDVPTLKLNRAALGLYTRNDLVKGPCEMWYDDVVAATSYIGPVLKRKKSGPVKSAEEMAKASEALAKGDLAELGATSTVSTPTSSTARRRRSFGRSRRP